MHVNPKTSKPVVAY